MRKIVFGINVTADGYCDHHLGFPDEEMVEYFTKLMQESDTLLYGRKTYELMFPYWSEVAKDKSGTTKADNDFAQTISTVPKIVVVSTTLKTPEDKNVKLIRGDLVNEIRRLKASPGMNISTGGINLPSQLLELGLIDEFHLVIHPTMAGKGRRLFEDAHYEEQINLKLMSSRVFKKGIVAHHYSKI